MINKIDGVLKQYSQWILPLGFLMALGATVASMFLSSVFDLVPCQLCWYQRVIMFPIPLILGVAILRRDHLVHLYALPFTVLGAIVALYHSLLQWGVVGESSLTCNGTISCADAEVELLGFLTIPFGAFLIFVGLTIVMWLQGVYGNKITSDFKKQLELLFRLLAVVLLASIAFLVVRRIVVS
jgi:disulfide bond formation protein DsbB